MEERLKELMAAGLSQLEALEVLILEKKALRKRQVEAPRWVLLGNFKCPICHQYSQSNLHGSGWGEKMVLRLKCEEHGTFIREPYGYWKQV